MKEIKFRGKIQKGYENAGQWEYFTLENFIDNGWGAKTLDNIDFKTIGLYIGFKDDYNKEIYEGDIVKCYGGTYCNGYYEYNDIVVVDLSDFRIMMLIENSENCKIIGNIYENSDLLKKVIKGYSQENQDEGGII